MPICPLSEALRNAIKKYKVCQSELYCSLNYNQEIQERALPTLPR
jgi:hypothetical protein